MADEILSRKHLNEFEKRTTQEMLDAPSYLDWTDEQLGSICRALALDLNDSHGSRAMEIAACVYLIVDGFEGQVKSASFKTSAGERVTITVEPAKE